MRVIFLDFDGVLVMGYSAQRGRDMDGLASYLVQTEFDDGLTDAHADRAIRLLGVQNP